MTVGEVADSLDFLLCNGGSNSDLAALRSLVTCAINGGDGNGRDRDRALAPKIDVHAASSIGRLGGDPVRLAVSTAAPSIVGLRIYDAAGRMTDEISPAGGW